MSSTIALLPIKEHSSRVPEKNFRTLADRPLYRWMLDKFLNLEVIDQVVVNTDARDRLEETGLPDDDRLLLRDRPEAIQGGEVSMNRIIEDDLSALEGDVFLQTHVTNPFLQTSTIRQALQRFVKVTANGSDSLFSVTRHQARFYRSEGEPVNHDPDELLPTQQLDPLYEENSNIYIFTKDSFQKRGNRIGETPTTFPMGFPEALDIDEPGDWRLAEILAETDVVEGPP